MLGCRNGWNRRQERGCSAEEIVHVVCLPCDANVLFQIGVVAFECRGPEQPAPCFGEVGIGIAEQLRAPDVGHAACSMTACTPRDDLSRSIAYLEGFAA